jgi:hypothetical protein
MAGITAPRVACLIVTPEAARHRRTQMVVAFGDPDVTAHAVAAARRGVPSMIEYEVFARLDKLGERRRSRMTAETWALIVWLRVTADAGRIVGDVERARVGFNAGMAARAGDACRRVLAMGKRLRAAARQPEHAGTCREPQARQADRALHRAPQRRPS